MTDDESTPSLEEEVTRELTAAYLKRSNTAAAELTGDLENWKPIGFLATFDDPPSSIDPDPGAAS
jgi:hypothetical protein